MANQATSSTEKTSTENMVLPKDGLAGLRENFVSDATSGFIVFLLAMPLSLGIARASDFQLLMGVFTAMIGGIIVSFFAGSRLTIKGPAAGLIVIVSGCVTAFGGDERGWHLTLGCIVTAAIIQIIFGLLKLGKYTEFVPSSAVHGMLAAIGLIIFSKQIYPLLGIKPDDLGYTPKEFSKLEPLELYSNIPKGLSHINPSIAFVGIISLIIMFGLPMIKNKIIKRIPPPLIVLAFAIPAGIILDFKHMKAVVNLGGTLIEKIGIHVSFEGVSQIGTFIQYVILFALIGTIESLLTVKAIDGLDPYHRKSDYNKDLVAVGFGNLISGILGGLPMISEVARSSANVNNGAKTRWGNFFHGVFMLLFVLVAQNIIEMIPNTALAAMLITVAYKLASPKEFKHTLQIGREQLVVFCATIVITLATDLLIGILSGIVIELLFNLYLAKTKAKNIFIANVDVEKDAEHHYNIKLHDSATFSNYLSIKQKIESIPANEEITIDMSDIELADHTVLENLEALARDYKNAGGKFEIVGLDDKQIMGNEHSSARARQR
jgi:MFS superfamily sulfate permease-like transporter